MEFWMGWLTTLLNLLPSHSRTITVVLYLKEYCLQWPNLLMGRGDGPERPLLDNTPTKDSIPIRVCLSIGVYQHAQEF